MPQHVCTELQWEAEIKSTKQSHQTTQAWNIKSHNASCQICSLCSAPVSHADTMTLDTLLFIVVVINTDCKRQVDDAACHYNKAIFDDFFHWLDNSVQHRPTRRNTPSTRSCPGSSTRMGTLWHVASLSFAANPVRSHREWAGVIDRITLPEPAAPQGSASPRVGALIRCLHRDFTSPNGQGR